MKNTDSQFTTIIILLAKNVSIRFYRSTKQERHEKNTFQKK